MEYTAGTTGISLALVCAAKGYALEILFSDAFSDEKRRTMLAFGARVTDVPSDGGRITENLVKTMIARAAEISCRPEHWYCDQLNNRDAIHGYLPMTSFHRCGSQNWSIKSKPFQRKKPNIWPAVWLEKKVFSRGLLQEPMLSLQSASLNGSDRTRRSAQLSWIPACGT